MQHGVELGAVEYPALGRQPVQYHLHVGECANLLAFFLRPGFGAVRLCNSLCISSASSAADAAAGGRHLAAPVVEEEEEEEEEEEDDDDEDEDEDEDQDEEAEEAAAAAAAVPSTRNDGLEPLGMVGREALRADGADTGDSAASIEKQALRADGVYRKTGFSRRMLLIALIARPLSKHLSPNFPAHLACLIFDRRQKLDLVYLVYTSPQFWSLMYRLGKFVLFLKNSLYHE